MTVILLLWLCIAAACDAIYRKCFNWIAVLGFILAIISIFSWPELHPVSMSFLDSFLGGCLGFFVLLIFYIFGMVGAGDVKFAAALGVWVGGEFLLLIWALSCGFAMIHGLVVRSNLKIIFFPVINAAKEFQENKKKFIPYVTYLSMATVIVLILKK